jgi:hypothetical protein
MKNIILLLLVTFLATCLTGCALLGPHIETEEKRFWVIKDNDKAKFDEDWKYCTSLTLAYQADESFRTQCMVSYGGHNIRTEYVNVER